MPRVLIIGTTGYVGRRIATLLVQSGQHFVYGIARTEEKLYYFREKR
jgi:nucleoside-diphosphate-sugar epimerase